MPNDVQRPRVTLEQLHTFLTVARLEHVTRAAEAIHLSQAAVSEQVRLLERTLGLQLLERSGRGVRVTPAGRAVERAAGPALRAARDVEQVAAEHRGLRMGRLDIAASSTTGVHRLPGWLAGFAAVHPGLDIRLRLANTAVAVDQLRRGEVDCAVVEGPFDGSGLEVLVLEEDQLIAVAGAAHPLAALRRVTRAALAGHRYLAREPGSGTEALAAQVLGSAYGRSPSLELGQAEAIRAGVLSGLGYAVISHTVVADDLAAGRIVALPLRPALREFRAVRRPGALAPALTAFWNHLDGVRIPTPLRA
jgi:DNA-binding transcriptional LysR family regulator